LQVIHKPGALLEETHYYPFGLTMAGISSKAAGKLENRYKAISGNEYNTDLELNIYETLFRSYDPQIGRFWQSDPLADDYTDDSPYSYAFNNPIFWVDPLGAENYSWQDLLSQIENGTIKQGRYYNIGDNTFGFQEIDKIKYDKKNEKLWIYFPTRVDVTMDGDVPSSITASTQKAISHDVTSEYQHLEESGWDYVPIVGSVRQAADDFKKGRWVSGIFNSAMAISDVFLIKALAAAPAKALLTKGLKGMKNYYGVGMSHSYGASVARWKKLGLNTAGYKHHWLITQSAMKRYPMLKVIGNQRWNLKSFSSQASHMRWGHGQVYDKIGYSYWQAAYPIMATPAWTKFAASSATMHFLDE
ncbi:MAG TPA: RHS repeat-associated core domain-containing protein, partial [Cyclobacteriaceae bacterium]|nr:RHS repeat-associated core domain-containing protein [Cyclobacteriaceae bacterium]